MNSKDRLLIFLNHLGIGQNAFEKRVGISNGYISHNKGSIGSKIMEKIVVEFPEINVNWLSVGEGEMLKSETGNIETSNIDSEPIINLNESDMKAILDRLFDAMERKDEIMLMQQTEITRQGERLDRVLDMIGGSEDGIVSSRGKKQKSG